MRTSERRRARHSQPERPAVPDGWDRRLMLSFSRGQCHVGVRPCQLALVLYSVNPIATISSKRRPSVLRQVVIEAFTMSKKVAEHHLDTTQSFVGLFTLGVAPLYHRKVRLVQLWGEDIGRFERFLIALCTGHGVRLPENSPYPARVRAREGEMLIKVPCGTLSLE